MSIRVVVTRGQLRGVKPGKAGGRGKGRSTGGAIKTPPVQGKTLEDYGIDKALAKRMRKAGKLSPDPTARSPMRSGSLTTLSIGTVDEIVHLMTATPKKMGRVLDEMRRQAPPTAGVTPHASSSATSARSG